MSKQLAAVVAQLAGVRVLVVGDAMVDHYITGRFERISPEAPVPILDVEDEFDRAGGAANAAGNIVALGGDVELICLAGRDRSDGRDPDAERLLAKCNDLGFEPTLLRFLPVTIRKARMLAKGQQLLRVDWDHHYGRTDEEKARAKALGSPWAPLPLSESAIESRRAALAMLLEKTDVVLVSDYAKGMVDAPLMTQLRASGKPVLLDPRPQHAELYKHVTVVTPNRREALQMLEMSPSSSIAHSELAKRLADHLDCNVLLTLSEEGMLVHERDGTQTQLPTRAREVFDPTGAGDTVIAVLALGVGAGLSLVDAARLANEAAGIVVGHVGTAAVTPDELRAALLETK